MHTNVVSTEKMKRMKKDIRKRVMALRGNLTPAEVTEKSARIAEHLDTTGLLDGRNHVLLYMDFRNEVATEALIQKLWSMGKNVYIPWVDFATHVMTIHHLTDFSELVVSSYGIREPNPKHHPAEAPELIDLILAPGVAFNKEGYRMGYGGGFYDRFLAALDKKPPVAALAFELQMCEDLPVEAHDIQLDYVITENGIYQPTR